MLIRTQSKWNSHTLVMGLLKWQTTLENSLAISYKVKTHTYSKIQQYTPGYLPREMTTFAQTKICT